MLRAIVKVLAVIPPRRLHGLAGKACVIAFVMPAVVIIQVNRSVAVVINEVVAQTGLVDNACRALVRPVPLHKHARVVLVARSVVRAVRVGQFVAVRVAPVIFYAAFTILVRAGAIVTGLNAYFLPSNDTWHETISTS
jgi:hypothetical protein